jgi:hypothetical protein
LILTTYENQKKYRSVKVGKQPDKQIVYRDKLSHREECIYSHMIDQQRKPLIVESDNVALTGDWHIPFVNYDLFNMLLEACEYHETRDIIVGGDFFDCDNYSKFPRLTTTATFEQELEEVAKVLKILKNNFDRIWFCRGNHEKRWRDLNGGKTTVRHIFALTEVYEGYEVTEDDHIHLIHNNDPWLVCHPKNYRQITLSVVRDLCATHHCNVVGYHGHQFAQGWDRSGKYRIADGGGMFHRESLDYLRETSCHPMTRNGFYILKDGDLMPFEPGPVKS